MSDNPSSLRERTRRAVQKEIAEAALELFGSRGFGATTIDDIAAAVGMSSRSVFRYFSSKEDIVVGKIALGSLDMLDLLRDRPPGEPLWLSLRRLFDIIGTPDHPAITKPAQRVLFETPALLAVYLQTLQDLQTAVVALIVERAAASGTPYEPGDLTPRALTAAAFGCVVAAQYEWLDTATNDTLSDLIDRAMAVVEPTA